MDNPGTPRVSLENPALPRSKSSEVEATQEVESVQRARSNGAIIVSWDGPNDIQNPKNWSPKKIMLNATVVSILGFVSPFSSSISSPGASLMAADLGSSSAVEISFITSIFVLGNALGPLLLAPASELWGRLRLFHICNILFVAFTLGCALATSLSQLLVFRFLAGCAGAGPLIISGGVIGDMISVDERGKYLAIMAAGGMIGPIIGPIAGGYLTMSLSWRWSFWIVVTIGGVITVVALISLRETHAPTILKSKVARLQTDAPDFEYVGEGNTTEKSLSVLGKAFIRPLKMFLCSPIVLVLTLFQALCFGIQYLLFTTFAQVFGAGYGFDEGLSGLIFLGYGLGNILGLVLVLGLSDRLLAWRAARSPDGKTTPEARLVLMIYGVPLLPIGLFWYGWSAQAQVHWIVPILGTFVLAVGSIFVALPGYLYLIDCYVTYSASALAAFTLVQSIAGAFLPLAGGPVYDALGIGWGTSVLAFVSIPFCLAPPIFVAYGEKLRKRFPVNL